MSQPADTWAILVSGGVDSCVLLAEIARRERQVHPLYVRAGLYWEEAELAGLRRFVEAVKTPALGPIQVLELPVGDMYGAHWSVSGADVPADSTPDEAVYLPGRNVLLLSKAMIWCRLHNVGNLGLAPLKGNPFPDATPDFFTRFEAIVNQAVAGSIRLHRPYAELSKVEVLQRGKELPLELTFSCIRPEVGEHCGVCNKCGERRAGFHAAGIADRTLYRH